MARGVVTEESARHHWKKALKRRVLSTDGVSAFSPTDLVDHTRDRLLAEYKAVQHLGTLIFARINTLSITMRLPAEVLAHVFSMLAECDPPSAKPFPIDERGEKQHLGWIVATHVCRRWRQVALSSPALWTNIGAPQTAPWMEEMLARSKQVPFTFSASIALDRTICDVIVKALGPDHISRMKGLHLSASECDGYGLFTEGQNKSLRIYVLKNLNHPAPMLETLVFKNMTWYNEALPQNIFANTLPRLRRFSLDQCFELSWEAPYFRNLTDLDLDFRSKFSSAKLLTLLKESPMLENLKISRRGPSDDQERYVGDIVSLPALKTFFIMSNADAICAELLSGLAIAPTARQEIRLSGVCPEESLLIIPVPTIPINAEELSTRLSPSTLRLICNTNPRCSATDITLRAWFNGEDDKLVAPQFFLRWNPATGHAAALRRVLGSFDVRGLANLVVCSEKLVTDLCDVFEDAFGRMSAIKKLTLSGRGIAPLLSYLENTHIVPPDQGNSKVDDEDSPQKPSLLFPELECLCISGLPFDKTSSDALVQAVKKRDAWTERLPKLVITKCEGSEPVARRLSKLVDNMCHKHHK
ncbi:hypothetical protein EWM64_g8938 [Hericium alpestre]|uniref:F-box domain-containing protein n=1 Tax=Hericium alpestre TaxID=135208 RepID=A0A4Y9ZL97_9AGAM|nr:hypothetical protein EWM64_g8938 [Hericium alpestre]